MQIKTKNLAIKILITAKKCIINSLRDIVAEGHKPCGTLFWSWQVLTPCGIPPHGTLRMAYQKKFSCTVGGWYSWFSKFWKITWNWPIMGLLLVRHKFWNKKMAKTPKPNENIHKKPPELKFFIFLNFTHFSRCGK